MVFHKNVDAVLASKKFVIMHKCYLVELHLILAKEFKITHTLIQKQFKLQYLKEKRYITFTRCVVNKNEKVIEKSQNM